MATRQMPKPDVAAVSKGLLIEPGAARPPYGVGKDWKPTDNVDPDDVDFGSAVDKLFGVKASADRKTVGLKAARWRTLKDGRHVAISGTEKRGAMTAGGEAKIRAVERKLADREIERGVAMTADGDILFVQEGIRKYDPLTGSYRNGVKLTSKQRYEMVDDVLTHNHPSGESFSAGDVRSAIEGNLAEVRAIGRSRVDGKKYLYRLTRPPGGWKVSWGTRQAAMYAHTDTVFNNLSDKVSAGRITWGQANFEESHLIWGRVFPKRQYSREVL